MMSAWMTPMHITSVTVGGDLFISASGTVAYLREVEARLTETIDRTPEDTVEAATLGAQRQIIREQIGTMLQGMITTEPTDADSGSG